MRCTSNVGRWLSIAWLFTPSCAEPEPPRVDLWPGNGWQETSPEAQGMSSADLATVVERLGDGLGAHALVVVRHGALVLHASFFPFDETAPHDLASVTKALTTLGIGLVLADHPELSPSTPLRTFLDGGGAITLRDALTMRAGLDCVSEPYESTLVAMQQASDWTAFTLGLPSVALPGTVYCYCSPVAHVLSSFVTRAQGQNLAALLGERVFAKLGMRDVIWPTDAQGNAHGWGDARMHARDLAKIGLLLLHGGVWNGESLLTASWIAEATRAQAQTAQGDDVGYMVRPVPGGFVASGRGGQFLYVLPALDLVVVAQGAASPEQAQRYGMIANELLLPAIRASGAIAEDPAGRARLRAAVERAAAPTPIVSVQHAPAWLGRRFELEPNPLGWQSFELAEDSLVLSVDGEVQTFPIGFDGVPRIAPSSRWSSRSRSRLALRGTWTSPTQLSLQYDTLEGIDAGDVSFSFSAEGVEVIFGERTFLRGSLTLRGR